MDFKLTEDQELIQQSIKEFTEQMSEMSTEEVLASLAEIDFLGIFFPEKVGGAEGDFTSYIVTLEELAKASPSAALAYANHLTLAAYALDKWGSEQIQEKYLAPLCKGEKFGSFALSEGWLGKDFLAINTTAEKTEDGYTLNGIKTFVHNGSNSDLYVVFAKTGEELSAFIVEKDMEGVAFGEAYKKMGLEGLPQATMTLTNVQVPFENLIGAQGQGFEIMKGARSLHSISLAAIAVAIAEQAIEKSIAYGKERQQFNRPIIKFEALQEMVGEMVTNLEAAKLLTYQAASYKDSNLSFADKAEIARYFALNTGEKTVIDAIQIHGGYGYSKDLGVEVLLRDLKGLKVFEQLEKPLVLSIAKTKIS